MHSRPFPRHLVPPRSKYSPQHHILKHPQLPFVPQCQRPSFTPIKTTGKIIVLYILIFKFLDETVLYISVILDREVNLFLPSSTFSERCFPIVGTWTFRERSSNTERRKQKFYPNAGYCTSKHWPQFCSFSHRVTGMKSNKEPRLVRGRIKESSNTRGINPE